jgi:hypothetical protein
MMNRFHPSFAVVASLAAAGSLVVLAAATEREARACGGCFNIRSAGTESTVVTDHRMAFSISTTQSVLWDQIKYSGNPAEFAWVLPVRQGAKLELSHDEWFAALEAVSQPTVTGPTRNCGSSGVGCAAASAGGASLNDNSGGAGGTGVQVISQSVVGPYETVTLRSTDPNALTNWLDQHNFAIPDTIKPTITAYVNEHFDFIALRLQPGQGVAAMQPVRVVTSGADNSLPLRMVAAGVGAKVGITLYVIGEGRYEAQNFPNALFDDTKLVWDSNANRSNYQDLSEQLMAENGGRTWLTEFAQRADIVASSQASNLLSPGSYCSGGQGYCSGGQYYSCNNYNYNPNGVAPKPDIAGAYYGQCLCKAGSSGPIHDASSDAPIGDASSDGSSSEGGSDAAAEGGPSSDGGGTGDGGLGASCASFDDMDTALVGMHTGDVWVTRMRAVLPVDALSVGDLYVQASSTQTPVSSQHTTERFSDPTYSPCGTNGNGSCTSTPFIERHMGTCAMLGGVAFLAGAVIRRRRARR